MIRAEITGQAPDRNEAAERRPDEREKAGGRRGGGREPQVGREEADRAPEANQVAAEPEEGERGEDQAERVHLEEGPGHEPPDLAPDQTKAGTSAPAAGGAGACAPRIDATRVSPDQQRHRDGQAAAEHVDAAVEPARAGRHRVSIVTALASGPAAAAPARRRGSQSLVGESVWRGVDEAHTGRRPAADLQPALPRLRPDEVRTFLAAVAEEMAGLQREKDHVEQQLRHLELS